MTHQVPDHEAVRFARMGLRVLPLRPGDKLPAIAGGFHAASSDLETVTSWVTDRPSANFGAVPASAGLVVLDVDVKKADGERTLADAIASLGPLPDCPEVRTPSGGRHLYLRHPRAADVPQKNLGGIDTRAADGYVVIPGSRTGDGEYTWKRQLMTVESVPECPGAWAQALLSGSLNGVSGSARAREWAFHLLDGGPRPVPLEAGTRNDVLASLAGILRNRVKEPGLIYEHLTKVDIASSEDFDLEAKARELSEWAESKDPSPSRPYIEKPDGLYRRTSRGEVRLTNFTARIVERLTVDDGSEELEQAFLLDASIGGHHQRVRVRTTDFDAMRWPLQEIRGNGQLAFVEDRQAGAASRAILWLSDNVRERTLYRRTGWLQSSDEWFFAHKGGGIGRDGLTRSVAVDLSSELSRYNLPEPPQGKHLQTAVKALLRVLDVAPDAVTAPLLASALAAPLGPWMDTGFSLWIQGPTGAHKTSLAETVQAAFGTGRKPLAGWNSTSNSIMQLLGMAVHVPVHVDDFKPSGSDRKVEEATSIVRDVIRSMADHTGRMRLRPDGTFRRTWVPGGILISTAERAPMSTQSDRARLLLLEMEPDREGRPAPLSVVQDHADTGLLAAAVSGYIRWLAGNAPIESLGEKMHGARASLLPRVSHGRTAEILAALHTAVGTYAAFVADEVDRELADDLRSRMQEAILSSELAAWQGAFQAEENVGRRFLALLRAGMAGGRFHVRYDTGQRPGHPEAWGYRTGPDGWLAPQGEHIGWINQTQGELVLIPEQVHAAVRQFARDTGHPFSAPAPEVWRTLADESLCLTEPNPPRPTPRPLVKRSYEGGPRFLVIPISTIRPDGETAEQEPVTPF